MLTTDQIRALIASGNIKAFYKDYDWRMLALEIIREHHGECLMCRAEHRLTRAKLVHHVLYLRERPDLAYSRTYTDADGEHIQLMPLCHACHERIHMRNFKHPRYTNEEKW